MRPGLWGQGPQAQKAPGRVQLDRGQFFPTSTLIACLPRSVERPEVSSRKNVEGGVQEPQR